MSAPIGGAALPPLPALRGLLDVYAERELSPFDEQVLQFCRQLVDEVEMLRARQSSADVGRLTDAETRVCRYLLGTLTYREIARVLHLSENTIKSHASSIHAKLHVKTRAQLRAAVNGALTERP